MLGGNVPTTWPRRPCARSFDKSNADKDAEEAKRKAERAAAKAAGQPLPEAAPQTDIDARLDLLLTEADGHADTDDADILAARRRFDELCAEFEPEVKKEAEAVRAAGGLFIIGTERHEIPPYRQPAARPCRPSGRPGRVPLLPVAGGRPDAHVRRRAGAEPDEQPWAWMKICPSRTSSSPTPSRALRRSWKPRNFAIRKQVLQYDDVMNQQREIIYKAAPAWCWTARTSPTSCTT